MLCPQVLACAAPLCVFLPLSEKRATNYTILYHSHFHMEGSRNLTVFSCAAHNVYAQIARSFHGFIFLKRSLERK